MPLRCEFMPLLHGGLIGRVLGLFLARTLSGDILAIAQTRRNFDMHAFWRSLRRLVYSGPFAGVVIAAVCIGVALRQWWSFNFNLSCALASRPRLGGGRGV